jgi:hypothetical protein
MLAQVFGEKHLFGTGLLFIIVIIFLWFIKKNSNEIIKKNI